MLLSFCVVIFFIKEKLHSTEGEDVEADVARPDRAGQVVLDDGNHLGRALAAQDPAAVATEAKKRQRE